MTKTMGFCCRVFCRGRGGCLYLASIAAVIKRLFIAA